MDMTPPQAYEDFTTRFPGIAQGWEQLGKAARAAGPLDAREVALVKLAIAIGSGQTGPVHSATRKALDAGVPFAELEQVVALSASTLGLPRAVAAWTWIRDVRPAGA